MLISILRLNLVLIYGIPPEFDGGVHLFYQNRHTPSGQSRVYRVTQLRTDGFHCRESAGTGPINLKVVTNECCLGRSLPSRNTFKYHEEVLFLQPIDWVGLRRSRCVQFFFAPTVLAVMLINNRFTDSSLIPKIGPMNTFNYAHYGR